MPCFRQHLIINVVTVAAIDTVCQLLEMQKDRAKRFDWGRLVVGTGAAAVAGALPDLLEPSLGNPNHRGFCHSLSAAILVWWLVEGRHSSAWSISTRRIMRCAAAGYTLHLLADLFLCKGKGMGVFDRDI
ncbi:MAG TPA: metal-dependent hydrolase [Lacunisphaera sp.]|nr:metal-dependent hydrolase [Lacunisphaera sp.]